MADLCHRNPVVYDTIMAHANMLISEIGFDGFRFDFVKGYGSWMIRSIHERQYVRGKRLVFPFGVGESWSSDGEIDAWLDEINAYNDNPISAFDFPLRYRLKDLCDTYGFSLRRLADGGTLMAERPEHAVTFVDNHDFRGGDTPPIVNDKLMAYAFILTHPGYPCVFWRDYFEQGLGLPGSPRGIAALVDAHERYAGGDSFTRHADDDLYIMERPGWDAAPGLIFVLNNRGDGWNGTYVDTTRANTAYRPVAWSGRDGAAPEATATGGDARGQFWAPPRGYAVYVPQV
jgi:alpha-amylase